MMIVNMMYIQMILLMSIYIFNNKISKIVTTSFRLTPFSELENGVSRKLIVTILDILLLKNIY